MKVEDINSLPAYAVYKQMIPGVSVYQEASKNPKKKNRRKKKSLEKSSNGVIDKVETTPSPKSTPNNSNSRSLSSTFETTTTNEQGSSKKKRNKKRKSAEATKESTIQDESVKSKRLKSTLSESQNEGRLPNPLARQNGSTLPTPTATSKAINNNSPKKDVPTARKSNKGEKQTGTVNGNVKADLKSPQGKKESNNKSTKTKLNDSNLTPSLSSSPKSNKKKKSANKATTVLPVHANNNKTVALVEEEDDDVPPIEVLLSSRSVEESSEHGKNLFRWVISPMPITKFMSDYWEKAPLHIKRFDTDPDYYKWLLSSSKLDDVLRNNLIRFGKNIDITSYTDGERQTHNPVGRAMPAAVWDYYSNGCSVRFLNPQTYVKPIWRLNASLQEYLGTFVGANVYLTPSDSQGFAPHYDDIEAFILQVEGRKHWKLYKPRTPEEELSRVSSGNFSEETDNLGEPILDVVLEEGDLLYFPRGIIHQAKAVDEHSLHITVSCYQTNTWGDLLKEYLSSAVDQAMANSVEFRRGLPMDYLSYMGLAHQDNSNKDIVKRRKVFINHSKKLVQEMVNCTTPDLAADQLGKKFMWDSLPPYITTQEKNTTSFGDGEFMDEGRVYNRCEFDPDVEIKLVRRNCIRLVFEESTLRLYFTVENSMEYHGEEPQFVEIASESEKAIKYLISSYPNFVKIDDVPLENVVNRVQLIADLWERGIVVTKQRLSPLDDDDEPTLDDDDFIDDIDIGDLSDDSETAEFGEDDDDDFDYDESLDDDDEDLSLEGDISLDDEYDQDDSELGLHSFDEFVESVVSDEDVGNGLGKSYVEELSSDDEAPQLVAPEFNQPKVQETKKKNAKRQSFKKRVPNKIF